MSDKIEKCPTAERLMGKRPVINEAGLAIIKEFEGVRFEAYPDPATGGDPWTIGYGTTVYPSGAKVRPGDECNESMAEYFLAHDLERLEKGVASLVGNNFTSNQFSALVSFAYNLGLGSLKTSTLLRKHNEGDYDGARFEFARWRFANGKEMRGLVRRRAAEAELYGKEG